MLIGVTTAVMAGIGFVLGSGAMSTSRGKKIDKEMQKTWKNIKKSIRKL